MQQCQLLEIARSRFYYQAVCKNDSYLANSIVEIYKQYPVYGYRRITACLRRAGYVVNHNRKPRKRNKQHGYFIFHNKNFPNGNNILINIDDSRINLLNNKILIDKLKECMDFLNTQFELKFMWLMIYPPKTFLSFHKDYGKNRHVVSFCENERFFNYEVFNEKFLEGNTETELNNRLKTSIDSIDSFNEYFLNQHEDCKITILEPNSVYTFGNTLHTFFNGSDTIRVNLVFEIVE